MAKVAPVSILLVDDDANNLLALESILEAPDHRLVKVQTADDALLALMQEDYAAIVLDVQMPDLSGIELARLIKQRKKTQHIPLIFLTAHYRDNEHAVLGYDVGAVDYLTKPVHPAVLRSKVSVFIDLFRKNRALAEINLSLEAEVIERKTAESHLRVVIEAAPSAMLVFTREGDIVLVNSGAEALFGLSREELLERNIQQLLAPDVLPVLTSAEQLGETPVLACTDARKSMVHRKDGTEVPVEISCAPIQSAEGNMLASIVDITERQRAEEALRNANAVLEAKNVALQRQAEERLRRIRAEAAQAEAEAANAAKDRFLAMLSHELRTPLSPVLHSLALIDDTPDCPAAIREALQIIRRNVQLEARLIDDLLDLARIRNSKLQLQFQLVDAHELLRRALEICQPQVEARGITLEIKLDAKETVLSADPARLQQIFWNLISNAVKFTPRNGIIKIATANDDSKLRVEVSDTGVGIEPGKLVSIFDAFEQAPQRASAGLGLGLAICKALAEFHQGKISAYSAGPGHGATFTVTLPVVEAAVPKEMEKKGQAKVEALPLRLMVVEDHADTANTLLRLLTRYGYHVESADCVEGALELARKHEFDVIVTDIGLPDGNGVDLFQQIRSEPGRHNLRGVALSGFGTEEDVARSKAAGFDDHLTKPVDFSSLHRRLAEIGQDLRARKAGKI
jgi:PAS domain S-box-containing protein